MYNELYHHGRMGQKWGERNGPPYPLSRSMVQREYSQKRRSGLSNYISEQKRKKLVKQQEQRARQIAKQQQEEESRRRAYEEAKARHDADRERVLREGTAAEVLQYVGEISNKELSDALNRVKWTNELKSIASKEAQSEINKGWNKIDKMMDKVGDVKDWAKNGAELLEAMNKIAKNINVESGKNKKNKG